MISSSSNKTPLYTTPGTGPFAFSFKMFAASDLEVVVRRASGAEDVLTYLADYTVSLNADQESTPGGTYTLTTAIVSGEKTMARRVVAATQGADIPNAGGWYPTVVEDALDRLTMLVQQAEEEVSRAVKTDLSSLESPDEMLARVEALVASAEALDVTAVSPFMATLLDDTNATEARATIGAASTGSNTFSGDQTLGAGLSLVFEGATDDGFEITLSATDPTADRAIALPNNSGTVALTSDVPALAAAARPYQSIISYTGTGGITAKGIGLATTGTIPGDGSAPQNTEGSAILDVTVSPSAIGAVIEVESVCYFNASNNYNNILALFTNDDVSAVAVAIQYNSTNNAVNTLRLLYRMTASSTDAITFKVRGGAPSASTLYWNRINTTTDYAGLMSSYIKATEVAYT